MKKAHVNGMHTHQPGDSASPAQQKGRRSWLGYIPGSTDVIHRNTMRFSEHTIYDDMCNISPLLDLDRCKRDHELPG
jgi:hypothetical protein